MECKYTVVESVRAHSMDVRVVKPALVPDGGIITGSRDCLVKVWHPNQDKGFQEDFVFAGATKFIASLCVLEPSTQYPNGLILAGSNDSSIYGFTIDSSEPVMRLLGHSDTVCALSAGKFGMIVSGSWDRTARIWYGQKCVFTLSGHQQAVWAIEVIPNHNLILTGSADHTIRLWRHSLTVGTCERTFIGHEDCVRGLAVMSDEKFMSCSNDQTVRVWKTSGESLAVYISHTDYIYSITLLKNEFDFATCGEDQNLRIWKDGECVQSIRFPCKSLWSVACLSNGDLAVGGSNGKLYVLKKITAATHSESEIPAKFQYGLDCRELSGIPPLHEGTGDASSQGTFDGEKRLYYNEENNCFTLYRWNAATKTWKKSVDSTDGIPGTVESMLSSNTSQAIAKEDEEIQLSVEVEGAVYKLCFLKNDNPWIVAQKFVAQHDISFEHVGQVVEFIIKNTPYTGNVPGSKKGEITNVEDATEYFRVKNYSMYTKGNLIGLKKKLLEFNELVPKSLQISPSQIDNLLALAELPDVVTEEQMAVLDLTLMWNDELIFPVLDLLRLVVRSSGMSTKVGSQSFITHLLQILNSTKQCINRVLVIKIICNLFDQTGQDAVIKAQSKIYESVKEALCVSDMSIQKAAVSLFLNFAFVSLKGLPVDLDTYCVALLEILGLLTEPEAALRGLVLLGFMYTQDSLAAGYFRSLNIKNVLKSYEKFSKDSKIMDVLEVLTQILVG